MLDSASGRSNRTVSRLMAAPWVLATEGRRLKGSPVWPALTTPG